MQTFNQVEIKANTLYKIGIVNSTMLSSQLLPSICVSGHIDLYGLDSLKKPTSLSEMFCPEANKNISGFGVFGIVPSYIYCKGEASSIVLKGILIYNEYEDFIGD